jgi:hypothetical protein
MSLQGIKIIKQGRDLVINDGVSIPKDHVLISIDNERDSVIITLLKSEYSRETKVFENQIEFRYETCTDPVATSTEDLFDKISKLKRPT